MERRRLPVLDAGRRAAALLASAARVAWGAAGIGAGRVAGGPVYAQISVSDACDHRCAMCPYHPPTEERAPPAWFGDALPGLMALEVYAGVIRDLAALGTRRVDLVGRGEPLLHPSVVEMVSLARRAGLEVTITSNGSRLDAARAEALIDAGLDALRISVDAARPATYALVHVGEPETSLARLVARVGHLVRLRDRAGRRAPRVTVSFTVGRENVAELDEMLELALATGADAAFFQNVLPMTERARAMVLDEAAWADVVDRTLPRLRRRAASARLETNLEEFARTPPVAADVGTTPTRCYVGYYFTSVLASGAVVPCCQTQAPVGHVGPSTFAEVWRGPGYEAFRGAARRLPEPHPALATSACDRCYFRPHNLAVDRAVRPLARRTDAPAVPVDQLIRMSRVRAR
jgi:MoaA/NifB/PqqE/SkfB family radical SAM enzyme